MTGQATCWFRPPEGVTAGAGPVAQRRGMRIALWSIDTDDWLVQAHRSADPHGTLGRDIAVAAVSGAGDHPVVLMHDGLGPGALRDGCAETVELTHLLLDEAAA